MASIYTGPNDYGTSVTVDGVNFYLITNGGGYFVGAVGHEVSASGSPLIIMFDSVMVNLGDVYQAIRAKAPPGLLP